MGLTDIARRGFTTDGLQAFWHAGNYDGNGSHITNNPLPTELTDLSGNGHNLTLVNFAGTSESGANGNNNIGDPSYIKLNGIDNNLVCTSIDNTDYPQGESTYCTMLNVQNYGGLWIDNSNMGIYAQLIEFFSDNQIQTVLKDDSNYYYIPRPNFNLNQDYLFAITHKAGSGGKAELFIDGVSVGSVDMPNDTWRPTAQKVATDDPNIKFYWQAIYNKVLTSTEIAQNYNAGLVWTHAPSELIASIGVSRHTNSALNVSKLSNSTLSASRLSNSYLGVEKD